MRQMMILLASGMLATSLVAGCSDDNPTGPSRGGNGGGSNGTVTWTWGSSATMSHSVRSEGSPGFTSSQIMNGEGSTHQATFTAPGSYQYDCAVHGQLMTGTIVVLDTAASSSHPAPDPMPPVPSGY